MERLEQVEFVGTRERLGAIGGHEFGQEMFDMAFGRVVTNDQVIRDLLIGKAFCQQREHFLFTRTQGIKPRPAPKRRADGGAKHAGSVGAEEQT